MDFALNIFIIIIDQLMLFAINLIVARQVGEVLFGNFSVATNGLLLIATLITLGIDSIIAYYIPKFYHHGKFSKIEILTKSIRAFLSPIYLSVFTIGMIMALAIFSTSLAFKNIFPFEEHHPLFLFIWGSIAISIYTILVQLFRSIDFMRTAVILSFVQTFIYFSLSIFIYTIIYELLFHANINYFVHMMLIGFLLSYIFTVIIAIYLLRYTPFNFRSTAKVKLEHTWKDKIYGYTIQNLNIYIFSTIPLITIEWLGHNEHSVGLFAAVSSIITLAFIGISPIGILIGPEISAALAISKDKLKKTMGKYLSLCLLIAVIITSVFGIFAKEILLLYKSNFIDALPYLYVSLINIITFSISMPLSRMIAYSEHGSVIGAKLTMSFLFLQTIASISLTYLFGIKGTVACYVGINIIYNFAMIIFARKIFKDMDNE